MARSDDPDGRFTTLWDAHHASVLAYALRRTDPDTARDVVAEAFTAAWRRIDQAPVEDQRVWLLGLARGALANIRRGDRRRTALTVRIADELRGGRPESGGLADAMGHLSERDAEALLLVAWEGLSNAEAARVMGCSTAAFAVRVHRARKRLATLMGRATTTGVVSRGSE